MVAVRQRLLLVLTWLVATACATAVGFGATQLVGDVIRGAGPLGPSGEVPSATAPTAPVQVIERHERYPAVEVVVQCAGRTATMTAVQTTPGWRVVDQERGPDEDVDIEVARGSSTFSVEFYCNRGAPQPVLR